MTGSKLKNRFTINQDNFLNSIYVEHLEEASFLYEQRLGLFEDHEIPWFDIDGFIEKRLEAHISGLFYGNGLALKVCRQQATEGDFGELHAAVCVFCRQNRQDLLEDLLDELDFDDDERVKAVTDALCYELPESWQQSLIPLLFDKGPNTICMAADVIAFQRLSLGVPFIETLNQYASDKKVVLSVLAALGRLRSTAAVWMVERFLSNDDPEIVQAAVSMLVRSEGVQQAQQVKKELWWSLDRGLCGGNNEFKFNQAFDAQAILSIGLIGSVDSIQNLITYLSTNTAENAALALNLISGAELYEDVFVPEEIDEDMLFEDELEKYRKGELYAPGEEPGKTITRLSQNPETWEQWWSENEQNFNSELRYRNGKPYSPQCLIENLKSEKSPNIVRKLAYEELVIRYNIDVSFETEMLVKDQISAIHNMEQIINENPGRFEEGIWYLYGNPM